MTEEKDTATEIEMETPSRLVGEGWEEGTPRHSPPLEADAVRPPAAPAEASVASAEPASSPAEADGHPTEPATHLSEASAASAEPASSPAEADGHPTEPATYVSEASAASAEPASSPAEADGHPTEPATYVSEASGAPAEPVSSPAEADGHPTEPATYVSEASAEPASSPAEADGHPTEPATYVSEASGAPAEPVSSPAEADGDPTEPATLVSEASAASAEPTPSPAEVAVERVPSPTETAGASAEPAATPTAAAPDEDCLRLAEALVFASAGPVSARVLSQLLSDTADADAVIAALRVRYAGRGVELAEAGNGVMFRTAPDLAPRLRKVIEVPRRLPRVAMETLAIIAYHQPCTRAEIEEIRGTSLSQQTLDALLEANLVAPKGRREVPGRPTIWGTTPQFLAQFGLTDIRDLPQRGDLLLEPPKPSGVSDAPPLTPELPEAPPETAPPADTETSADTGGGSLSPE